MPSRGALLVRTEPGAIGVGQEHVVVLGEEARRRRNVGVGERRVGHVVQHPTPLVGERAQARSEPLEHLGEPGEPRPGRDIGGRRRTEGGEVAEHDLVDRRARGERPAGPRIERRHPHRAPLTPESARWHLHEREVVAARVREWRGVEGGEVLGEGGAQLGGGERSRLEQGARRPAAPV